MTPIRCASCARTVAVSPSITALRNAVYCNEWCYDEIPATPLEERNDQWRFLVAMGASPVAVSRTFGVAHSLVYKTINRG